ncbi:MAG TPA: histidine kinase [Kribbella sp.]|nr:histidine kinase [Kribbella sp.]
MRDREFAIDAGTSALALAATLLMLTFHGFGTPDPGVRDIDAVGILLALGSSLPLLARRYAPLTVYVLIGIATVAMVQLAYALDAPVGLVFAMYPLAMAYGADPSRRRRLAVMVTAAIFLPAMLASYAARGGDVQEIVPAMLSWTVVFAGVWIAGDRARLRRVHLAELEERAIRTDREAEQDRRLAAAEERTRIARELHDSAGHAINVILVQAGAARMLQDRDPERSRRAITTIEEVARTTITEIDRLVTALREDHGIEPPAPAEPAAFDDLLERHRANGLTIAADICGRRRPLPGGLAWAAYRILQEALTNAARHGPGRADVALAFRPDAIEITVTNPTVGRGDAPASGGHGIVGMRERASLLGGTLQAAGSGGTFRLHAWLPERQDAS